MMMAPTAETWEMPGEPLLEVTDLHVALGGLPVLAGVSLSIAKGETVLVRGANASGKTTLLRAIAGFTRPHHGRVLLCGRDVTRTPADQRIRQGIGMVPENRGLFPDLTVADNLLLCRWAVGNGATFQERLELLYAQLPLLHERRDTPTRHLSGGQQQLLAIARMILQRPRVLLLDDPLVSLDEHRADFVLAGLVSRHPLWVREGASIVAVEQHGRLSLKGSAREVLLERGRLVPHAYPEAQT